MAVSFCEISLLFQNNRTRIVRDFFFSSQGLSFEFSSSHTSSPFSKKVPSQPHPHPTRPPYSLGPQVSRGLGAFSLTEARPDQAVLCCPEPHISWCMLSVW